MKKIIIIILIIGIVVIGLFWFLRNVKAVDVIDSYSESNYDYDFSIQLYYGIPAIAQSFTAIDTTLDSCKFYLKKVGSPTGNAIVRIYNHTGTYGTNGTPTSTPIASSDNFNISTLTTDSQLITFNFSGAERINLINGTYYCISIEVDNREEEDYIQVGADSSSPSHSGNWATPNNWPNPTTWSGFDTRDLIFYVYGEEKEEDSPEGNIEIKSGSFQVKQGTIQIK